MKIIIRYIILIILFQHTIISAQNKIPFEFLRYNEDYSVLSNDSTKSFYLKTKHFNVLGKQYIYGSIGSEIRSQYQYFENEDWGDAIPDKNGFLFNRALLHTDLHFTKHFRIFTQLQSSTTISRIAPNPIEENPIDLHQLFFDINFNNFTLRTGRQEFLYGSQRLISVREGPNSRQSFDALKLIHKGKEWHTDIFYSQFVRNQEGNFNDKMSDDIKLWGVYNVFNNVTVIQNIDFYFLGLEKQNTIFDDAVGKETRYSFGTRFWGNKNNLRYDLEGVYQFGTIDYKSINAWTFSINTSYKLSSFKFNPNIGLKTEFISGDKNYDDNKLQTFNPLFPKGAYFGLAALIGPSNLIDIHPSIELELNEKLTLDVDYDVFWRASLNDGIYQPNTSLLYSGKNTQSKHIGNQLGIHFDYTISDYLNFEVEGTWFNSKELLEEVSTGSDILFLATTVTFKF